MSEGLTIVLTAVIGATGGFFAYLISFFLEKRKNMMAFNMLIFKTYDRITQDIIDVLIEMTSLHVSGNRHHTKEKIREWKEKLSFVYYKYYNYLPKEVLNEINCLHSCLIFEGKFLYVIKEKNNMVRSTDEDAIILFDDATLVSYEGKRISDSIRKYSVNRIPKSMKINLQARRVITTISKFFGSEKIEKWTSQLKKETLLTIKTKK